MKVFLSWSGELSHEVAVVLKDWLPFVIQTLEPFVSTEDIEKGDRWSVALDEQLRQSSYAILCVTQENINAPWLNFEAGVLSKDVRVSPFLFGVDRSDIKRGPLLQFQSTVFQREDLWKLIRSINNTSSNQFLDLDRLAVTFDTWWPRLERSLDDIANPARRLSYPYPIGGATPFQGALSAIPLTTRDHFYMSAHSQLEILGHSLSGLWAGGGRNAILSAIANGVMVRIVYLDPTPAYSDQINEISARIERGDLRKKIRESLDQANSLKANLHTELKKLNSKISNEDVERARERLQIAASRLITYVHIQRADDAMLVSQYSQSQEPGRVAPTMEILRKDNPDLFDFYEQEFYRIWEEASPIEETVSTHGIHADRSRILTHLPTIQKVYRSVKSNDNDKEPLPYPRMLVVLPNMNCTLTCRNCFTWRSKAMDRRTMDKALIHSIAQQAEQMNVSCLELSGGGEPLDHPRAEEILQTVIDSRSPNLQTGLLTNGIAIAMKPVLADQIVKLDYVRIGYTEYLDDPRTTHEDEEREFWQALEIIGRKRMETGAGLRIGVKVLLTNNNAKYVDKRVVKLLEFKVPGTQQYVVDHIKIKSIRGDAEVEPRADLVREMEHKLALVKSRFGDRASDLQIDMKSAEVPASYRCWISPIMSVIDASGDVYLCCNFYESPEDLRIGSLGKQGEHSFSEFWGEARHRAVMKKISPARVCNSRYGCHCRLVHYQEVAEPFVPYADRADLNFMPFFSRHEDML
jgi:MoaA/NifB/PqqE/SkfB family radical SAM enzyme